MIKTIIFDFGGVLGSNSDTPFFEVLIKNGFAKDKVMEIWEMHWPKLKNGAEHVKAIWNTVKENTSVNIQKIIKEYNDKITVNQEMLNVCKVLKKQGCNLGLLANEASEWMDIKRKKGDLNKIFDKIFSSADIKLFKPNKEAYEYILNSLKSKPKETLFIDDMERNTKAAEKIGIQSIVFKNINRLKKDLAVFSININ